MKRYDTLDALRGVAAGAVVVFHMNAIGLTGDLTPHGYLAVDFFFELSGLVLALANRTKLANGMGFRKFATRRFIRIYPMALVGILLGILVNVSQWYKQATTAMPIDELLRAAFFNVALLPNPLPTGASDFLLFPGNGAIWSLFFEVGINLVWAMGLWRLRASFLAVVCLLCAGALIPQVIAHGDASIGWSMQTIWGGVARVGFGFLLGTLVEVGGWRLPAPSSPRFGIVLGIVLLAVLFAPEMSAATPYYDLTCIILVFPVLILLGMTEVRGGAISDFLGVISYPLYAVHFPLLYAARFAWRIAAGHMPLWVFCVLAFNACVAASLLALKVFDEPVRNKMTTLWQIMQAKWNFEENPQKRRFLLVDGTFCTHDLHMVRIVGDHVERRTPTIDEFNSFNRSIEQKKR